MRDLRESSTPERNAAAPKLSQIHRSELRIKEGREWELNREGNGNDFLQKMRFSTSKDFFLSRFRWKNRRRDSSLNENKNGHFSVRKHVGRRRWVTMCGLLRAAIANIR